MTVFRSQNGYTANDPSLMATTLIPGTGVRVRLRRGPVATVLAYVGEQFDDRVEDIDTANTFRGDCSPGIRGSDPSALFDDWGYAARPVRGQTKVLSNHASGSALDLNAVQHPRGVKGTFTAQQVSRINDILDYLKDPRTGRRVVRWGGDYENAPVDGMHFEIDAASDAVARVAAKITAGRRARARAEVAAKAHAAAKRVAAIIAARKAKAAAAAAAAILAAWIATGHHGPVPKGWKPTPAPSVTATATATPGDTATPTVTARPTEPPGHPTPTPTPITRPTKATVVKAPPVPGIGRTLSFTPGHKPMTGADVRAVQRLVHAPPDGRYGKGTAKDVARWQETHHLTADGVFGEQSAHKAGWRWSR